MRQRPLILLTTAVLAAHVALLAWPGMREAMRTVRITGSTPNELRFETRQITLSPPAPAPMLTEAPRQVDRPAPPKPAKPKPPAAKVVAQKAPPEQAEESRSVVGPKQSIAEQASKPTALDGLLGNDSAAATPDTATSEQAAAADDSKASDTSDEVQAGTPAEAVSDANSADPPALIGIGSPGYSAPLPPVRVPPNANLQFEAKGTAKGFQYSAKAQLQFTTDGLTYQARQDVSAFLLGNRVQTSVGRVTPHGLVPQRFGDKARSERAAHVDVDKGRITYSGNDTEQGASAGVQDRLSIFLQLASMIAAGPERYPPGTQIHINVTSARAADVWTFVVDGPEILDLPAGSKPTIRLTRQPRKRYDQTAHLWLAPDLQYLPVRIRITQANGDFADLQLQSATVDGVAK